MLCTLIYNITKHKTKDIKHITKDIKHKCNRQI